MGSSKTASDCKLHFDEFYIEDARGDFCSFAIDTGNTTRSMRVDEPITCANTTNDFVTAPMGAPVRPMVGSITCKGMIDLVTHIVV